MDIVQAQKRSAGSVAAAALSADHLPGPSTAEVNRRLDMPEAEQERLPVITPNIPA
jgi:hypothetical protein